MFLQILFTDFITKKAFLSLQNRFQNQDDTLDFQSHPNDKIINNEFYITVKVIDEEGKDFYKKIGFYNFLKSQLKGLSKGAIGEINKRIKNNFQYNPIEKKEFLKITLKEFFVIDEQIEKSDFLDFKIKEIIQQQITEVIDYLNHIIQEGEVANRLQFNLNSNDLLLLLYLFNKNKLIKHTTDAKLGALMESYFEYFNEDEKTHKKLSRAGKSLNNIKNSNKSINKSLSRLKDIFNNPDFFEL